MGYQNETVLWNTGTCEIVGEPIVVEQQCEVTYVALSSNGKVIVTGFGDGSIQRYYVVSGDVVRESMYALKGTVISVGFCANDELIVAASYDGSIIRRARAHGEQIREPIIHNGLVRSICISGDGRFIVSCMFDCGLCRWDLVTAQLIGESASQERLGHYIWTNNDCTKIVTGTSNRPMTCWSVAPGGVILKTSSLPLPADVAACAIDVNHGVAAVGLANGAFAFGDIYE